MKKILMQFAGNLLSKEQMKVVKGGDTYGGIYGGDRGPCATCGCGYNGAYVASFGPGMSVGMSGAMTSICGSSTFHCNTWTSDNKGNC